MNGSKLYRATGIGRAPRRGQPSCVVRWSLSPHPALSLRKRVSPSLRGEQSRPVGFSLRDARCSLPLNRNDSVVLGSAPASGAVGRALAGHSIHQTCSLFGAFGRASVRREGAPNCSRGGCAPPFISTTSFRLRERVRVRGNGAVTLSRRGPFPGLSNRVSPPAEPVT
jgi:hypothetical protein